MPRGRSALPTASRPPAANRARRARARRQPSVSLAKEGAPQPKLTSGGRRKVPFRGRLAPSPGKEEIPRKGGVSIIFGRIFPSLNIFVSVFFGFPCVCKVFFSGDGIPSSHPGDFILLPRFWLSGRALDSVSEVPGSNPTFRFVFGSVVERSTLSAKSLVRAPRFDCFLGLIIVWI